MDCRRIRELLSPYIDGELPLSSSRLVVDHLDSCAKCRSDAAALRAVCTVVREVAGDAPNGLGARILSSAQSAQAGSGIATALPRIAALLVGAASMTLVLSLATSDSPLPPVGEPRSEFHLLIHESQSGLGLEGTFGADLLTLARRPESRLLSEVAGGR